MDHISTIIIDLLIILSAGLLAGTGCKRFGVPLLAGYLVVGAVIGQGALNFVHQENHELEYLAQAGALLLLFSIGIEFSFAELILQSRRIMLSGLIQMVFVAVPLTCVCLILGMPLNAAILVGSAAALSSTVLVFKSLTEWGQTSKPHGRRAIGILLFQDIALVPLMLLVPILTNQGAPPALTVYALLLVKSLVFVVAVVISRHVISQWIVPTLANMRSIELVILFALCVLVGVCMTAFQLGLSAAVGALAAGFMLNGNRLSKQIDTIILPFRESFSAVFFVTLGTLLQPLLILQEPVLLITGLLGILFLKSMAATIALRVVGLKWPAAFGMGMGLAQLGEFSFLLLAEGVDQQVISRVHYNRLLFIALVTMILTPLLLKYGFRWTGGISDERDTVKQDVLQKTLERALVIGIGPIGRQVASRLELMGVDVCLMDLSPINLYDFAQQGFFTVAGDARDPTVLERANAQNCGLMVVSVPDDEIAHQVVKALHRLNTTARILVRCRYQSNIGRLKKAGAMLVISEEAQASGALLDWCEKFVKTTSSVEG